MHIISGLSGGGAEISMARLAARLQKSGVTNVVICLGPRGAAETPLHQAAVDIHFLDLKGLASPARFLRGLFHVAKLLRAERPDLIQGWMYQGSLAATIASAWNPRRIPVLWSIRQTIPVNPQTGRMQGRFRDRAVITVCRWLSGRPAAIVFNSQAGAAQAALLGFQTARFAVIQNGIDTEKFRPLTSREKNSVRTTLFDTNPERLLAGAVGRSHPMKDHETFIRAAALVAPIFPEASFLLIGRGLGDPQYALRALAHTLGVESRFIFADERPDMERCLGMIDVMVSSSAHSEGFPNVIAEAMACGIPCVGTDVGDTAVLIGDTGLSVAPRNPQALATALASLFSLSTEARAALGARARERILHRFTLDENVRKHLELYRKLNEVI